jgi:hypothetical protein
MRNIKPDALRALLVFAIAKDDARWAHAIVRALMNTTGARHA